MNRRRLWTWTVALGLLSASLLGSGGTRRVSLAGRPPALLGRGVPQAVASFLFSYETKRRLMRSSSGGMWIFLVLVFMFRDLRHALWGITFSVTAPLGLTAETFHHAFREFRFWM